MNSAVGTTHLQTGSIWSTILNMTVPSKVKVFVWILHRKIIPTCMNLRDKGIECPVMLALKMNTIYSSDAERVRNAAKRLLCEIVLSKLLMNDNT